MRAPRCSSIHVLPPVAVDANTAQVDPAVVDAKVQRELDHWRSNAAIYRRRGWILLGHEGTDIDVGFLASVPVPGVSVQMMPVAVRFDYSDYDLAPPSVRFIDPASGADAMPMTRALQPAGDAVSDLLIDDHPLHHRPFLCVPGSREYHEHPQHSGDLWLLHRGTGAGRLAPLCDLIWRTMSANLVGMAFGMQMLAPPRSSQANVQFLQGPAAP
jgi:hypothetical protein